MNALLMLLVLRTAPRHDEEAGASAVEYGLLVAGIAAIIVGAVFLFGDFVSGVFGDSCGTVAGEIESRNADC